MIEKITLNLKTAASILPERDTYSNKGTFGKALLICGSKNMVGCCVLAAQGALRSGVGIVCLAFPECLYAPLTSRLTENLFFPLPADSNGFIKHDCIEDVLHLVESYDVVLIGCGIGITDSTKELVRALIEHSKTPLILDADALNCLCNFKDTLVKRKTDLLLTPHPGEMARLLDTDIKTIEQNRINTVIDFCTEYGVNLLLKGHETLICNSASDKVYINKTGNTGLSKGGAGDLLSGIIAGLTPALKGDLFTSAALGAFIHGLSADLLKSDFSEYSMLPSDCAENLNKAFKLLEECSEKR